MSTRQGFSKILSIVLALAWMTGCATDSSTTEKSTETESESQEVDVTDAHAVATAFVAAVMENNNLEAVEYVIPDEREKWLEEMENEFPPFPDEPDIEVHVTGDTAEAEIVNADEIIGFDMIRKEKKRDGGLLNRACF